MVKKGNNWIAEATSKNKGAFRAQAKAAGKSTAAFAAQNVSSKGTLGKRARLAQTLMKINKKR